MKARERATPEKLARVAWRVSSRSGNGSGNCVEAGPVLDGSGRVAVRDSTDRTGPALAFTYDEWRAFLGGIKAGAYDPT